jgi:hypothetical protein
MRKFIIWAVCTVGLLGAAHSHASVLFATTPDVANGAIATNSNPSSERQAAADFEIGLGDRAGLAKVTGLQFWTIAFQDLDSWPDGVLDVIIWGDNDSTVAPAPDLGKLIYSTSANGVGVSSVPYPILGPGVFRSTWSVQLDAITLDIDTRYWLGLSFGASATGIFWQLTSDDFGASAAVRRDLPSTSWTNYTSSGQPQDVAFQLNGVPIPATTFLIGLGLPAIAYVRRRRRA